MPLWFVLAQYICLCIWLVAMSAAPQFGAYPQRDPYLTSDLELGQASNVYNYTTHEVRQHVGVRLAGLQVLIAFADHS
jgi:hypothetical protein